MLTSACQGTEIEDLVGEVAWFSNMRNQPAVEPYEEPARTPPEGVVPVGGMIPAASWPGDYDTLANPTAVDDASLVQGRDLYEIYCIVCHGAQGRGGGNVEGPFPAALIPRLDTPRARELSDGYLFGIISAGRGLMPSYRRVPQPERWHIVNYVRHLQALTPTADGLARRLGPGAPRSTEDTNDGEG